MAAAHTCLLVPCAQPEGVNRARQTRRPRLCAMPGPRGGRWRTRNRGKAAMTQISDPSLSAGHRSLREIAAQAGRAQAGPSAEVTTRVQPRSSPLVSLASSNRGGVTGAGAAASGDPGPSHPASSAAGPSADSVRPGTGENPGLAAPRRAGAAPFDAAQDGPDRTDPAAGRRSTRTARDDGQGAAFAPDPEWARADAAETLRTDRLFRRVGFAAQAIAQSDTSQDPTPTTTEAETASARRGGLSALVRRTATALYSFVRSAIGGGGAAGAGIGGSGGGGVYMLGDHSPQGVDLEV